MAMTTFEFSKRAAIVIILAIIPVLLWYLRGVLLIVVGSILISILLDLVSRPFVHWGKLPHGIGLMLAGILILGALAGCAYLFSTRMGSELQDVLSRANSATSVISEELHGSQWGRLLLAHIDGGNLSLTSFASSIVAVSTHMFAAIIITVAVGGYFAAQPELYRRGLRRLFPKDWRPGVGETIDDVAVALQWWLLGQVIQMLLIGMLSALAVWLIGLPSPLALGVIAGIAELVPYLGPLIAAVPASLVALNQGLYPLLWTVVAYLLIHQIEGNLILPLLQRRLVFIPPAAMLLSIVAVASFFGTIAIVFAAPITVIIFTAIKKLYIRDSLHEAVLLPGDASAAR